MDLKEAFNKAIEFEQKGYAVYEAAAFKTKNEALKKVFKWLGEQERLHEDWLRKKAEKQGVKLPDDPLAGAKDLFLTTTKEFREKLVLSDEDLKAYEHGLQLEKESYEYYQRQHDSAEDEELRIFYSFMMEQEQSHYDLLEQTRDYLADPELFYQKHEGWLFEGG